MSLMVSSFSYLAEASLMTVFLSVVSIAFGLVLGLLAAVVRVAKVPVADPIARVYISIIRGTPLLVQIFIVYFGLPQVGLVFGPITSAIIALSLNVGAYLSESFRAAIESVDHGQMDAALSLSMTYWQAMRRIIVPQSFRTALPTIGNSYISLLKDTSLVSVITVQELLRAASVVIARTYRPLTLYIEAAAIYWILSFAFSLLQQRVERTASKHVRR
ncbi:MAG: amino acid ABC transporter permease [Bacillota bacterium]